MGECPSAIPLGFPNCARGDGWSVRRESVPEEPGATPRRRSRKTSAPPQLVLRIVQYALFCFVCQSEPNGEW